MLGEWSNAVGRAPVLSNRSQKRSGEETWPVRFLFPKLPVAGGSTWLGSGQFSLVKVYWWLWKNSVSHKGRQVH